ncbi:sensor histidine kinase, partial [Streptomyces corynorhini]
MLRQVIRQAAARGAALRSAAVLEARATLAAVRAAPRRTKRIETALCLAALAAGVLPLLYIHPGWPVLAVAEACWAALLVPARRRWPVCAVLGMAPLVSGGNMWTVAVTPLVVLAATRRIDPPRRAWSVVLATSVLGMCVATLVFLVTSRGAFESFAGAGGDLVMFLVLPALSGTLLGQRRPLVRLLQERNAYLEQTRVLTAATSRMEERARIAGEMHDMLGHRLSLISVHAGALELAAARQAPSMAGQAELLRTTAGTAMEELREILDVLRREELAPSSRASEGTEREPEAVRGTRADLTALVTESRRAGVRAELVWSGPDSDALHPRVRLALHRVVREALTNVHKHAAGAPTRVEVAHADDRVEVTVTNEAPRGTWRPMAGNRSGLAGLEERIALIGGSFAAGPVGTAGFRITAALPCHDGTGAAVASVPAARDAAPGTAAPGTTPGTTAPGPAPDAAAPGPQEVIRNPAVPTGPAANEPPISAIRSSSPASPLRLPA